MAVRDGEISKAVLFIIISIFGLGITAYLAVKFYDTTTPISILAQLLPQYTPLYQGQNIILNAQLRCSGEIATITALRPDGRVLPNARVFVVYQGQPLSPGLTSDAGVYSFPAEFVGYYDITVTHSDLQPSAVRLTAQSCPTISVQKTIDCRRGENICKVILDGQTTATGNVELFLNNYLSALSYSPSGIVIFDKNLKPLPSNSFSITGDRISIPVISDRFRVELPTSISSQKTVVDSNRLFISFGSVSDDLTVNSMTIALTDINLTTQDISKITYQTANGQLIEIKSYTIIIMDGVPTLVITEPISIRKTGS